MPWSPLRRKALAGPGVSGLVDTPIADPFRHRTAASRMITRLTAACIGPEIVRYGPPNQPGEVRPAV